MKNHPAFRRALLRWFRENGRDLPWRLTRDPYAVLVSEMMLQQTQVAAMLPYYNDWLGRFPNFAVLARATEREVLHAWEGLGYYNRARNLHATAQIIQNQYCGIFPREIAKIGNLPGIGRYTANAVASFAFDRSAPIVEANSARVLARLFNLQTPIDSSNGRAQLWRNAANLVPKRNAGHFNSALLDLGALVCLPRNPCCGICPVKVFCRAKDPESLPIKRARPATKRLTEDYLLFVRQNQILLEQSHSRWRKMWILPPRKLDDSKRSSAGAPIYSSVFPFTHHLITLRVFRDRARKTANSSLRWFSISSLDSIPIPSPHRRAINALLN